ncbi:MAG: DNA-binding protein [Microgenomates group bacterium]
MPKTYSVKEAAAILGFSTNTIYSFLNAKKLKGLRIGKGKFRIPQSEIDRMTGASASDTSISELPVIIEHPHRNEEKSLVFQETIPYLQHLSLTDWFIGMGSIIFGLSMFIYTASIELFITTQLMGWYWVLRVLFILFGVGFLTAKISVRVPPIWVTVYQCLLIGSFGWFIVISHLAHDTQGTVVGFFICLIMLAHLFFKPAYHTLIALTVLEAVVVNTILFVFAPEYLALINASFGITVRSGIWGQLATLIVPFVMYLLLVVSHRFFLRFYYFLIILGSVACHITAYFCGVHLFWRQGLEFLFTGIMLFIYAMRQTDAMKAYKKTWVTGTVLGLIFACFLAIVLALRVFELTMFDHANKELQVKAENGKTYLETVFGYAKKSFDVSAREEGLRQALETKDRKTLTESAKNIYEQFPHMYRIVILDKDGTELANYPEDAALIGKNYAYREYFQDALIQEGTVFSGAVQTSGTVKRYTIIMASPIVEHGTIYGAIAGSFDMDELGRNLQSFAADEEGEYFGVLDRDGVRIINPDITTIGSAITSAELDKFKNIPYWKENLDTRINPHGVLVHATYRSVDFANVYISAVQPYKENLQANLIALCITLVISAYGYIATLIAWYVCYRKSKKHGTG